MSMNKIMLIFFIVFTIVFGVAVSSVFADEVTPEKKPIELRFKGWVTDEWNDIKKYQAKGWQDGKEQLARNKEQIANFFSKLVKN